MNANHILIKYIMDRPLTAREKMHERMNKIRREQGLPEQPNPYLEPATKDPYILENSADLKELPLTMPSINDTTTVLRQNIFRKPENSNATYYSQLKAPLAEARREPLVSEATALPPMPLGKYEKTEVSNLDHNSYFVFDNNGVKTNVNSIMPIYYTKVPLEPITAGSKLRSKKQIKRKRSNKKRRAHTRRRH